MSSLSYSVYKFLTQAIGQWQRGELQMKSLVKKEKNVILTWIDIALANFSCIFCIFNLLTKL